MEQKRHSFRVGIQIKIGVILIVLSTMILAGYGLYQYHWMASDRTLYLDDLSKNTTARLAENLTLPMWGYDMDQVERIILSEMREKNVFAVLVKMRKGQGYRTVKGKCRDEKWQIINVKDEISGDFIITSQKIVKYDDEMGLVELYVTPKFIRAELRQTIRDILLTIIFLDIALFVALATSLRNVLIRHVHHLLNIANAIASGDFEQEIAIQKNDEIGELADAFQSMNDRIVYILNNINELIHAVRNGRLDVRSNCERIQGDWKNICMGLNHLIDAFVVPITMTSASLDQLSKGIIPKPITKEYRGDFNDIRNNLNMLIDATSETTRIAEEIASGNLTSEVRERSEQDRMMKALNQMIRKLNEITDEINGMIRAVGEGHLDIRGNAEAFEGGWQDMVAGVNDLIRGLSHVVSKSAALTQEMALARKIQTSLLPTLTDGMHPDMEVAATMVPADQVGGDFYDITFDRAGSLWFAVGDVSGHGVTPGLIMMMAQTIHTTVTANLDCEARDVVIRVNEILYRNVRERLNERHFMTFTALKYMGDGRFQHAGAHLSMLVFRHKTGACERIRTKGVYLNFKKDISKATKNGEFSLESGDVLILYTDGLTEAESPDGEMLDLDGFVRIVERHAHRIPEAMKDAIMADVITWCDDNRADDMTLVIVKRKET